MKFTLFYVWSKMSNAFRVSCLVLRLGVFATIAMPVWGASDQLEQLAEVVVTAQKREENQQKIPVAVTVYDAKAIESRNLVTMEQLSTSTPGLQIGAGATSMLPYLRGVGSNSTQPNSNSSVAVYIDGVYYSVLPVGFFTFGENTERVEVLKGPQGTLFGHNSSGGVIQLVTKDPSHTTEVAGTIGYGNYGTTEGKVYATTGLSETIAADISLVGSFMDRGYGVNVTTGNKANYLEYYTIRSKILWEPTSTTRITLTPFYGYVQDGLTGNTYPGTVGGYASPPFDRRPQISFYDQDGSVDNFGATTSQGVSLKFEQQLAYAKLSNIASYSHFVNRNVDDGSVDPRPDYIIHYFGATREITDDLQLSSLQGSPVTWVFGLYYYNNFTWTPDAFTGPDNPFGPPGGETYGQESARSYSAYGQATYEVLPQLDFTAGMRYSVDRTNGAGYLQLGTVAPEPRINSPSAEDSFDKFTYKTAIDYKFTDAILGYASYSVGYKSGQFNLTLYNNTPTKPEILYSYELGLKTDVFNKRIRLNATAFYYDIVNPQVQLINGQTGSIFFSNAERAGVKGGELEGQALVTEGLIARLSASGLDSRYKSYQDAPSAPPIYTPPYGATSPALSIDASGNYTPQAPKWTGDAGLDYAINDWTVSADYFYNSGFFWEPDNILRQKSYSLVNAQIKYAVTSNLAVRLWGKNLTSAEYASRAGTQGGTAGYPYLAAPPRTYGIAFDFKL